MLIATVKETIALENRVALIPQHVAILTEMGHSVNIETNAGQQAGFEDTQYQQAGAKICKHPNECYKNADVICKIWAPQNEEISYLTQNQTIICDTQNIKTYQDLRTLCSTGINLFALDLMPRISRAQSMDILSSQNNLSGYVSVIVGAQHCPVALPLMITSAGTISPIKILIMGLGVAGLQAAATAHRLGAQLYAFDNRPETEEQAASLGAVFVHHLTDDLLSSVQMIITSALSPGNPAPKLLTREQLKILPSNCVIIDMAADSGGNISDNKNLGNLTIISDSHLARYVPQSASILYSGNMFNFIRFLYDKPHPTPYDFEDEIIKSTCICYHNQCHHPFLKEK